MELQKQAGSQLAVVDGTPFSGFGRNASSQSVSGRKILSDTFFGEVRSGFRDEVRVITGPWSARWY